MEVIQEMIGQRKKQQILNTEATKVLSKQIKKVQTRDISEPPPVSNADTLYQYLDHQQNAGLVAQGPQAPQQHASSNHSQHPYQVQNSQDTFKDNAQQCNKRTNQGQQQIAQEIKSSKSKRHQGEHDNLSLTKATAADAISNGQGGGSTEKGQQLVGISDFIETTADQYDHPQSSTSRKTQQHTNHNKVSSSGTTTVKKQVLPQPQQSSQKVQEQQMSETASQQQLKQQQLLQAHKQRKVRSKSPPMAETSKNPAAKIKKYYGAMIPAFTNKKRENSYYTSAKQGFTYINWDMEEELYIFQTQIEQKFKKSTVNQKFRFPRALHEDTAPQKLSNGPLKDQSLFSKNLLPQSNQMQSKAQSQSQSQIQIQTHKRQPSNKLFATQLVTPTLLQQSQTLTSLTEQQTVKHKNGVKIVGPNKLIEDPVKPVNQSSKQFDNDYQKTRKNGQNTTSSKMQQSTNRTMSQQTRKGDHQLISTGNLQTNYSKNNNQQPNSLQNVQFQSSIQTLSMLHKQLIDASQQVSTNNAQSQASQMTTSLAQKYQTNMVIASAGLGSSSGQTRRNNYNPNVPASKDGIYGTTHHVHSKSQVPLSKSAGLLKAEIGTKIAQNHQNGDSMNNFKNLAKTAHQNQLNIPAQGQNNLVQTSPQNTHLKETEMIEQQGQSLSPHGTALLMSNKVGVGSGGQSSSYNQKFVQSAILTTTAQSKVVQEQVARTLQPNTTKVSRLTMQLGSDDVASDQDQQRISFQTDSAPCKQDQTSNQERIIPKTPDDDLLNSEEEACRQGNIKTTTNHQQQAAEYGGMSHHSAANRSSYSQNQQKHPNYSINTQNDISAAGMISPEIQVQSVEENLENDHVSSSTQLNLSANPTNYLAANSSSSNLHISNSLQTTHHNQYNHHAQQNHKNHQTRTAEKRLGAGRQNLAGQNSRGGGKQKGSNLGKKEKIGKNSTVFGQKQTTLPHSTTHHGNGNGSSHSNVAVQSAVAAQEKFLLGNQHPSQNIHHQQQQQRSKQSSVQELRSFQPQNEHYHPAAALLPSTNQQHKASHLAGSAGSSSAGGGGVPLVMAAPSSSSQNEKSMVSPNNRKRNLREGFQQSTKQSSAYQTQSFASSSSTQQLITKQQQATASNLNFKNANQASGANTEGARANITRKKQGSKTRTSLLNAKNLSATKSSKVLARQTPTAIGSSNLGAIGNFLGSSSFAHTSATLRTATSVIKQMQQSQASAETTYSKNNQFQSPKKKKQIQRLNTDCMTKDDAMGRHYDSAALRMTSSQQELEEEGKKQYNRCGGSISNPGGLVTSGGGIVTDNNSSPTSNTYPPQFLPPTNPNAKVGVEVVESAEIAKQKQVVQSGESLGGLEGHGQGQGHVQQKNLMREICQVNKFRADQPCQKITSTNSDNFQHTTTHQQRLTRRSKDQHQHQNSQPYHYLHQKQLIATVSAKNKQSDKGPKSTSSSSMNYQHQSSYSLGGGGQLQQAGNIHQNTATNTTAQRKQARSRNNDSSKGGGGGGIIIQTQKVNKNELNPNPNINNHAKTACGLFDATSGQNAMQSCGARLETEEGADFDIRELDERQPCKTMLNQKQGVGVIKGGFAEKSACVTTEHHNKLLINVVDSAKHVDHLHLHRQQHSPLSSLTLFGSIGKQQANIGERNQQEQLLVKQVPKTTRSNAQIVNFQQNLKRRHPGGGGSSMAKELLNLTSEERQQQCGTTVHPPSTTTHHHHQMHQGGSGSSLSPKRKIMSQNHSKVVNNAGGSRNANEHPSSYQINQKHNLFQSQNQLISQQKASQSQSSSQSQILLQQKASSSCIGKQNNFVLSAGSMQNLRMESSSGTKANDLLYEQQVALLKSGVDQREKIHHQTQTSKSLKQKQLLKDVLLEENFAIKEAKQPKVRQSELLSTKKNGPKGSSSKQNQRAKSGHFSLLTGCKEFTIASQTQQQQQQSAAGSSAIDLLQNNQHRHHRQDHQQTTLNLNFQPSMALHSSSNYSSLLLNQTHAATSASLTTTQAQAQVQSQSTSQSQSTKKKQHVSISGYQKNHNSSHSKPSRNTKTQSLFFGGNTLLNLAQSAAGGGGDKGGNRGRAGHSISTSTTLANNQRHAAQMVQSATTQQIIGGSFVGNSAHAAQTHSSTLLLTPKQQSHNNQLFGAGRSGFFGGGSTNLFKSSSKNHTNAANNPNNPKVQINASTNGNSYAAQQQQNYLYGKLQMKEHSIISASSPLKKLDQQSKRKANNKSVHQSSSASYANATDADADVLLMMNSNSATASCKSSVVEPARQTKKKQCARSDFKRSLIEERPSSFERVLSENNQSSSVVERSGNQKQQQRLISKNSSSYAQNNMKLLQSDYMNDNDNNGILISSTLQETRRQLSKGDKSRSSDNYGVTQHNHASTSSSPAQHPFDDNMLDQNSSNSKNDKHKPNLNQKNPDQQNTFVSEFDNIEEQPTVDIYAEEQDQMQFLTRTSKGSNASKLHSSVINAQKNKQKHDHHPIVMTSKHYSTPLQQNQQYHHHHRGGVQSFVETGSRQRKECSPENKLNQRQPPPTLSQRMLQTTSSTNEKQSSITSGTSSIIRGDTNKQSASKSSFGQNSTTLLTKEADRGTNYAVQLPHSQNSNPIHNPIQYSKQSGKKSTTNSSGLRLGQEGSAGGRSGHQKTANGSQLLATTCASTKKQQQVLLGSGCPVSSSFHYQSQTMFGGLAGSNTSAQKNRNSQQSNSSHLHQGIGGVSSHNNNYQSTNLSSHRVQKSNSSALSLGRGVGSGGSGSAFQGSASKKGTASGTIKKTIQKK